MCRKVFVGDGFLHVPKRYRYIKLKFGLQWLEFYQTYPLELHAEALGYGF